MQIRSERRSVRALPRRIKRMVTTVGLDARLPFMLAKAERSFRRLSSGQNVFGLHGHSGSALFDMNQWSPEAYMAAYERDVREYHGRRATRRPCAPDCETGK